MFAALAILALAADPEPPLDPAYVAAYRKFVDTKWESGGGQVYNALVVFVGTPLQDRQGYWNPVLVEVPKLRGFKAPCIVVSVMHNGEPVIGKVHQGGAYDFDIYKAWLSLEYPRPMPQRSFARPVIQPFASVGACRSWR